MKVKSLAALPALLVALAPASAQAVVIDSHNFGEQTVDTPGKVQAFTLINEDFASWNVSQLTLRGSQVPHFRIENDTCSGNTIAPGGQCGFVARFAPKRGESSKLNLNRSGSNASADVVIPDWEAGEEGLVRLSGRALVPSRLGWDRLEFPTDIHRFDTAIAGREGKVKRFWLRASRGNVDAVAGRVMLTGDGADQFQIVNDICTGRTFESHSACYYDVAFRPTRAGIHTASVAIEGSDLLAATGQLRGTGLPTVKESLRKLTKRLAARINKRQLDRALKRGSLRLAKGAFVPVTGEVWAALYLRGRERPLFSGPAKRFVAGRPDALGARLRAGVEHALAEAGGRPRLQLRLEIREPGAEVVVGTARVRLGD